MQADVSILRRLLFLSQVQIGARRRETVFPDLGGMSGRVHARSWLPGHGGTRPAREAGVSSRYAYILTQRRPRPWALRARTSGRPRALSGRRLWCVSSQQRANAPSPRTPPQIRIDVAALQGVMDGYSPWHVTTGVLGVCPLRVFGGAACHGGGANCRSAARTRITCRREATREFFSQKCRWRAHAAGSMFLGCAVVGVEPVE
ncbi:hypothetical protein WOLCODRAFT_155688 [Wolfiporia cocos MD-104 SS10]|uniref:Uncharacterized protein n=1 Tax=Wolfiporia cocos (strain MD-104) TaxID=742152 RepID=A0A2H3JEB4_WOLCO|nr:hypothetical protein WOLCODRAFT_155688 [Wolfiporia cocos MD-104 SS10]